MVSYDPQVIQKFAESLYSRAKTIVIFYAIVGVIAGFAGGASITKSGDNVFTIALAALGLILGFMIGQQKAFALKLMAQEALCQVEIEKNTRGAEAQRAAA